MHDFKPSAVMFFSSLSRIWCDPTKLLVDQRLDSIRVIKLAIYLDRAEFTGTAAFFGKGLKWGLATFLGYIASTKLGGTIQAPSNPGGKLLCRR